MRMQCHGTGYEQAMVNIGGGRQMVIDDVRKSDRWMVDSPIAAGILFERLRHLIPTARTGISDDWKHVGLNERLRFLRYSPGGYFAPHCDGQFVNDKGQHSLMTVMIYLNEPLSGGETNFLNPRNEEEAVNVRPKTGLALVFDHPLLHEGALLLQGVKYAIRTDVMFERCIREP